MSGEENEHWIYTLAIFIIHVSIVSLVHVNLYVYDKKVEELDQSHGLGGKEKLTIDMNDLYQILTNNAEEYADDNCLDMMSHDKMTESERRLHKEEFHQELFLKAHDQIISQCIVIKNIDRQLGIKEVENSINGILDIYRHEKCSGY